MKKHLTFTVVCCLLTSTLMAINPIQKQLDSIAMKWAPDKREAICSFKVKRTKINTYIFGETTELNAIKAVYKALKMPQKRYIDKIKLLPDTSIDNRGYGLVQVSVMNIRKHYSHNAELLSQAVMGTPVRILKDSNEHFLLQTPDNYIGWATHASIARKTAAEMADWKKSKRLLFTAKAGVIYSDLMQQTVLTDITMTSIVTFSELMDNDWIKVSLPDSRIGYIDRNQLTTFNDWAHDVKPNAESLKQLATQFMGTSYLWGGTSSYMLDCSGFMKTIYFMQGIILPRDASLQYQKGTTVEISEDFANLHEGDLLFFGSKTGDKLRITHVGMYYGNKEFIHESEWVHINSLDKQATHYSPYYTERLLVVRRYFDNGNPHENILNNQYYF